MAKNRPMIIRRGTSRRKMAKRLARQKAEMQAKLQRPVVKLDSLLWLLRLE